MTVDKGKRKRDEAESSARWKGKVYQRRKKAYKVVPVKQPALPVYRYQWFGDVTAKTNLVLTSNANIIMMNCFKQGRGDDNRTHNQTMLYKMRIQGTMWVHDDTSIYITPIRVYFFLVYDAEPKGALPTASDVFSMPWATLPATWTVQRSNSHRFVVKRRWHVDLQSGGLPFGKQNVDTRYSYPVAKNVVDMDKFFTGLRLSTEWMNTGDGTIADVKKGAVYCFALTRAGLNSSASSKNMQVVTCLEHSCYFKSIGLQ